MRGCGYGRRVFICIDDVGQKGILGRRNGALMNSGILAVPTVSEKRRLTQTAKQLFSPDQKSLDAAQLRNSVGRQPLLSVLLGELYFGALYTAASH